MIKHFDVVLRCEGPVHIGAGTQIPKRELWYDEKKQRLSVLDIPRMMRDLTSRQRESLYSFLLGKTNRFEMRQMLSDMGLQEEKIRQWEKYGFPFQKNAYRNMRDIMCCVKDGFGFPYVPGSSLKGALRTIFLSYQIQNDKQAKEKTLNHMANEFYRSAYKQNKVAKQMAPTDCDMVVIVAMCTIGMPYFSISFTIVAPQRVQVPQVEVRMTPSTPASFSSLPISAPNLIAFPTAVPVPVVV
jgi:CRISPR type III-A-associated RAMP protein Csm5